MAHWADEQLRARGIHSARVLDAMQSIPREVFIPAELYPRAYEDGPLPIGFDQTISQPYIVAYMTQALELRENDRVLEVGTGSGYQTAVLARMCAEVFTIEIVAELQAKARRMLKSLGFTRVHYRQASGWDGWPEEAPFDAIMVTAAAEQIPPVFADQLKDGGRIVIPVGPRGGVQQLMTGQKKNAVLDLGKAMDVRFVPLIHQREEEKG
jgi:protein-L-isoaspartate(D-aspartate) O-methyltransferase